MAKEQMPADYGQQREAMKNEVEQTLQNLQTIFERHSEKLNLANLMELKQNLEKVLHDLEERADR